MEVLKNLLSDEGYFEEKLNKNKINYTKISDVRVYDFGFNSGMVYDIYDYKMRKGQRVLLCVTTVSCMDDISDEALIIKLEDDEKYDIEEVKELIKDYNSYCSKKNVLDIVYTFAEAAELWGLSDGSVLRNAVRQGRFKEEEYRQSGKVWLVTKVAMERLYGEKKGR